MTEETAVTIGDSEFDVLPIGVLLIDDSYQRELRERIVRDIVTSGYDIDAAGLITVSERPPLPGMHDPRYFIVDGQHRAKAAARTGEDEILVKIVRFKGGEAKLKMQEASLRGKLGARKADTPIERFKHQLASGNDESMAISALVESYGGHVTLKPNSRTGIQAISALETIYRKGKLDEVLRIIKKSWDTFDNRAGEASTLQGLFWFVQKHEGEYDEAHLTRRLRGVPPEALHARAGAIRAGMAGSQWKNVYRAMVEFYNTRPPAKVKRVTAMDY